MKESGGEHIIYAKTNENIGNKMTLFIMGVGFFSDIPTIELCMMPVVIKLFIHLQDARIYTDTRLYQDKEIQHKKSEEFYYTLKNTL